MHLPPRPQHFLSVLVFCSTKLSYSLTSLATRYFVSRAKLYAAWVHTYKLPPGLSSLILLK